MAKLINCLKLIDEINNQIDLAKQLSINYLQMLELIGKINQVEHGLINTSSGNGFFLTRKLDWLDEDIINKNLKNGYTIKILPELASTNSYILNNLNILANKTAITTEFQYQGRGRGNKAWTSKIATDIIVSLLYLFELDFNYELLPFVIAIAINRLLKKYNHQNYIKWPNDIYLSDSTKISGMLLESGVRDRKRFVVIGIGLDHCLSTVNRSELVADLINHVEQVLKEYSISEFDVFRQEWLDNCLHHNKKVNLYRNNKLIDSGINIDLTFDGKLVLQSKHGINEYISSNISLRVDDVHSNKSC